MIIDLKENSGLGLKLDINRPELVFEKDLEFSPVAVRTLSQMREVLLDKDIRLPQELYYMYRDIYRCSEKPLLEEHSLRYDVTVIKPHTLGREFMKTAGHYHPGNYGELYEVVSGRCFCLLQRPDAENHRRVKEIVLVEALSGQKIVIPPGFGHILINPGPDYLVTSNWVSRCFDSHYDLYRDAQGAAFFAIVSSQKNQPSPVLGIKAEFIKNPYFEELGEIKFARPCRQIKRFGLSESEPMYALIVKNPACLDFLNHPLNYEYDDVFILNS